MNKKIIITGGAGYVGSQVSKCLFNAGFEPVVVDNLSRGNKWAVKWGSLFVGDLKDKRFVDKIFKMIKPVATIHLAAYADIGESNLNPLVYYENNILTTINLLNAMKSNKLNNLIFSSSCSIFGIVKKPLIDEKTKMKPISPYAYSKMVCEEFIKNLNRTDGFKYFILRYFNAAGADVENEIGEFNEKHKRIIPEIIKSAVDEIPLTINGKDYETIDGTCVRDYVHITDISEAHVLAVNYLLSHGDSHEINIGSGKGTSILEIVKKVESILSKKIKVRFVSRRLGDADRLVASIKKAKKILNWMPKYSSLNNILQTAISWHKRLK